MSYIGKIPTVGNFQVCDAIATVNGQAAYTMQVGGVNVSPESANHMLVSLNGVIQKPTDAYTVSNSVITFASNLVTGDVINFIQILGNVLDLGVPSDATVSTAKIVDANVTLAKLSATGTKDSTTFLRGDNTFAAAGGITLLGTLTTTSGTTQTLGSLSLTNYKLLFISLDNVGGDSITTLKCGGINVTGSNGTATHSFWGNMTIDLTTSAFSTAFASDLNTASLRENAGVTRGGNIGFTTGTTSIAFTLSAGSFSRGTIKIYGAK